MPGTYIWAWMKRTEHYKRPAPKLRFLSHRYFTNSQRVLSTLSLVRFLGGDYLSPLMSYRVVLRFVLTDSWLLFLASLPLMTTRAQQQRHTWNTWIKGIVVSILSAELSDETFLWIEHSRYVRSQEYTRSSPISSVFCIESKDSVVQVIHFYRGMVFRHARYKDSLIRCWSMCDFLPTLHLS